MNTDYLCIILIIILLIIGWIWTAKDSSDSIYKIILMYILTIIGGSIIGFIFFQYIKV